MDLHFFKKNAVCLLLFASTTALAQQSLKFESASNSSGTGPAIADQLVTFHNGDAGVYSPATNVTFRLSNQQYNSVEPYAANNMFGVVFGGNGRTNGNTVYSERIYSPLNYFGLATNGNFSTNGATPAINVANDYAVELAILTDALINPNGTR